MLQIPVLNNFRVTAGVPKETGTGTVPAGHTDATLLVGLADADRADPASGVDIDIFASNDGWATRTFIGGSKGWRGGTIVDKTTGQTVPMPNPFVTVAGLDAYAGWQVLGVITSLTALRLSASVVLEP